MQSTYLVTGGAGFVGSHIVEALLTHGKSVRAFDNLTTGKSANLAGLDGQLEFVRGDIRDRDAVKAAMTGVEVVFHQAALASVPQSIAHPAESLEVNVTGTQNVLLAARDSGVRRVVYASSSSVYGDSLTLPQDESMLPHPLSPYAVHKLTGEYLAEVFSRIYGLETVALRYFNVFGPRQDPASPYSAVIPLFISALLRSIRPVVFGDGEQTRDFTYVANVVQANLLAADAPNVSGRVMNIGNGKETSLNEVLRLAAAHLGRQALADYEPTRAGDIRHSLADIELARHLLGYSPQVSFDVGLARTVDAMVEA